MEIEKLYFHTLDELRKDNDLAVEDFCNDICSIRMYWRYLNGSNLCPPKKFTDFLIKLRMTYNEFYYFFYAKSHSEQEKINILYTSIIYGDAETSFKLIDEIDNINLSTYESEQFYDLCKILYEVEFSDYSNSGKIEKYSTFINYPNIIKKEHVGFIELCVLSRIAIYESELKIITSANYLYSLFKAKSFYLSSNSRYVIPALMVTISKIFGNLDNLEKSYEIANQGIKYSIRVFDSNALSSLYYISALCEYKMGMRNKFSDNLIKCLATLISNNDTKNLNKYKNLIKTNFKVDDKNLLYMLSEYINKKN